MATKTVSSPKRTSTSQARSPLKAGLAGSNKALGKTTGKTKQATTASRLPLAKLARLSDKPDLVQAVLVATRKTPLSVAELLQYLQKAKHKFATGNPDKELKLALKLSPALKDYGGKFGPSFGR